MVGEEEEYLQSETGGQYRNHPVAADNGQPR